MVGTPLIGRERELAVLGGMLADASVRLVTLTGPGGVGKTRVAYALADAVAADGAQRAVRVDLAPLGDAALVADAIAAAAHAARADSALDAAAAALGDGPTLLVLDNFEHVGAAAGGVATLLETCPGITALISSRDVVGLAAEHVFPLAPLALAQPGETDAARAGRSAAVAAETPTAPVATLFGAAEAELEAADIVLEAIDGDPFRSAEATLRAALGDERFAEAVARGRRLTPEERGWLAGRVADGSPRRRARTVSRSASWRWWRCSPMA